VLVGCELRVPARGSSLSVLPSPFPWRVGVHIVTFEACSSFTRVTACKVAHPPYVGFIARLRPGRFPGSGARKLPSSTNNLLGWVLPPLVICAVEAHTETPLFGHNACFRVSDGPAGALRRIGRYTAMWQAISSKPVSAPLTRIAGGTGSSTLAGGIAGSSRPGFRDQGTEIRNRKFTLDIDG
jgi:hypothetical protein